MPTPVSLDLAAGTTLPPLWHADRLAELDLPVASTGFAALDAELPGGGWPQAGLTELLTAAPGSGELPLLAPALRDADGPLACIAPPWRPYGPALRRIGLLERLIWIDAEPGRDAAWAAEQALRSHACRWVMLWWHAAVPLRPESLRRLHLGAIEAGCALVALRPLGCRTQSSPAPLRLALKPTAPGRMEVEVFKRRGPPAAVPLQLALPLPASLRLRPRARRPMSETADAVAVGPSAALVA